jgi:hypothetical protein
MFEQTFKNIDGILQKNAGCTSKLMPLLRIKSNNAISNAVADLGETQIRTMFSGFQQYLYESRAS